MIKLENYEVVGWEHAIRGMRNPKNSWDRSDSFACRELTEDGECFTGCHSQLSCPMYGVKDSITDTIIGPNDHKLMMQLANGGPVHAKYRRMITVYVDITAPLYWWKEFDTYKVGTVVNSCSTMHKIDARDLTIDDFSTEKLFDEDSFGVQIWSLDIFRQIIEALNIARKAFKETGDKRYFDQMIQLLPSSYNQKRTVMLNYEVLAGIYYWRKNHKLDEWREFCAWIESLPYSEIITGSNESESLFGTDGGKDE